MSLCSQLGSRNTSLLGSRFGSSTGQGSGGMEVSVGSQIGSSTGVGNLSSGGIGLSCSCVL